MLSDCPSKLIPWNKNAPAVIQSHPGWAGGGDGLGGSWGPSGSFPSPAEWDLAGAEGAQSPTGSPGGNVGVEQAWGVVSIISGTREPSEVLPKLRQPQEKPWKGKSSC